MGDYAHDSDGELLIDGDGEPLLLGSRPRRPGHPVRRCADRSQRFDALTTERLLARAA